MRISSNNRLGSRFVFDDAVIFEQLIFNRIDERQPTGFDDIVGNTDRSPVLLPVTAHDEDSRLRRRSRVTVDDPDLVIGQH